MGLTNPDFPFWDFFFFILPKSCKITFFWTKSKNFGWIVSAKKSDFWNFLCCKCRFCRHHPPETDKKNILKSPYRPDPTWKVHQSVKHGVFLFCLFVFFILLSQNTKSGLVTGGLLTRIFFSFFVCFWLSTKYGLSLTLEQLEPDVEELMKETSSFPAYTRP